MPAAAEKYLDALTSAVDTFDRPAVARTCDELIRGLAGPLRVAPGIAGRILETLRRKRHFQRAESVGAALLDAGVDDPAIWKHYAQALIEQKKLAAAIAVLSQLVRGTAPGSQENLEGRGLTGRVFKQLYIDDGDGEPYGRQSLIEAVRAYKSVFDADPARLWHGLNAVALTHRARRDGVALPAPFDADAAASAILAAVRQEERTPGKADAWHCATAMEACIALGRWPEATDWAARYVQRPGTDAFELASTLRQLVEVWQLDPDSPDGGPIVLLLKAQLLRRHGGEVEFARPQLAGGRLQSLRDSLEARLSTAEILPLDELLKGVKLCRSIAQVQRGDGSGAGTGFVVSAAELGLGTTSELLLLTNAHVVSNDPKVHKYLARNPPVWPQQAQVHFQVQNGKFKVAAVLASSHPERLDFSLLRLTPTLTRRQACPLDTTPDHVAEVHPRVYVIGHPGGGRLAFSLSDNAVLGFRAPKLHYRAPTEGGSSGSPVFSTQWDVVALHHAGSLQMPKLSGRGKYPANEGIWMAAIKQHLARNTARARPGRRRTR